MTVFSAVANGQDAGDSARRTSANPAVVVVGSAARGAWSVTRFTAKHVVAPVAKTIFLKAAPAVAKFALKNSAKHLLPVAVKLSAL